MTAPELHRLEIVGPVAPLEAAYARATDADPPLALAASLFEHDAGQSRRLELLLDSPPDRDALLAALGLTDAEVETAYGALAERDWVALSLEGLPPISAGRFHVRGSHHPPRRGGVDIVIEASEAFGTGHHATTLGCLLALDDILKRSRPRRVLDLGAGSGVLAIALAKVLRRRVIATDIDPEAVRITRANAAANDVAHLIDAVEADAFDAPALRGRRFDLIVANILAGPLQRMAGDIARAAAPGAHVVLSGLLEPQAPAVRAAMRAHGLVLTRAIVLDGWATLVMEKP